MRDAPGGPEGERREAMQRGNPERMDGAVGDAEGVLAFWFGLERPGRKDDAAVAQALGPLLVPAREGALDGWIEAPRERLALVLLLDQAPRHVFRDRPEQYAGDAKAQQVTRNFVERADWSGFTPLERYYALAPWLHAEDAALQEAVNPLIHALAREDPALAVSARIADLYRDTIRRFGRFPHRDALLGRPTGPAERAFLEGEWRRRKREAHQPA